MSEPRHLDYLDALRGYAIFAVIAIHAMIYGDGLPQPLMDLLRSGQSGVQLFFVVSAITLMRSWHVRQDGAGPFYMRRLFRLAPMWLLFVAGWTVVRLIGVAPLMPGRPGVWDVVSGVLFVHGWFPTAINGVVPGGWSIGAEACFYAIFPLLAAILTTPLRAIAFALLAVCFSVLAQSLVSPLLVGVDPALLGNYFFYWFPNQLQAFAFGIVAYQIVRARPVPGWVAEALVAIALAAIVLLPILTPFGSAGVYGLQFAVLATGMGLGGGRYLVNRLVRWCGERSYSAYFWHFVMLGLGGWLTIGNPYLRYVVCYLVIAILAFAASNLSYRFIELPGIALGKRLLARRASPTQAAVVLPAE
jgi:peptidoglycan/LPS O-acetylase OafA/YrhL